MRSSAQDAAPGAIHSLDRTQCREAWIARHKTPTAKRASLGRVFSVTRETWALTDDPKRIAPETAALATRRTAADAADIARESAAVFRRHGFHKPTRACWGADETHFHRFLVHTSKSRPALTLLAVSGLTAVAAVALLRKRGERDE